MGTKNGGPQPSPIQCIITSQRRAFSTLTGSSPMCWGHAWRCSARYPARTISPRTIQAAKRLLASDYTIRPTLPQVSHIRFGHREGFGGGHEPGPIWILQHHNQFFVVDNSTCQKADINYPFSMCVWGHGRASSYTSAVIFFGGSNLFVKTDYGCL